MSAPPILVELPLATLPLFPCPSDPLTFLVSSGEWCVDKGKLVVDKMTTQGNMSQGAPKATAQNALGDGFHTPPGRDKNQWGF